jgi:hypothetical protein
VSTEDIPTESDQETQRTQQKFSAGKSLIGAGFACFPAAVYPAGDGTLRKAPLTRHGHLDAHTDLQRLYQELVSPPHVPDFLPPVYEIVIAFVPGSNGCGVLDCDIKHGHGGQKSYLDLVNQHGAFAYSAWRTPSGGQNILFRKPVNTQFGNASPWSGIDVRADNGWVVAPGNSTQWGNWEWLGTSGPLTAQELPAAMIAQLSPAQLHGRRASNAETVAFIEASPQQSSGAAAMAFGEKLKDLRNATEGSRHQAMLGIIGWAFGMDHLDLRYAVQHVKREWDLITAGERREDEVDDVATWIAGQEIARRAAQPPPAEKPIDDYQPQSQPGRFLNWREFANRDPAERRWLVEGFWPAQRALALWATGKTGKSELALWCAAKLALGEDPWTDAPIDPIDVAYFDYEMIEDDLDDRLSDFGMDPLQLGRLHYALLPNYAPLDVDAGGRELVADALSVNAQAVIIDTFARATQGNENDSDTVRDFARNTGDLLKREGIAYLRTDHAGKDLEQGQRGTSAKRDDIDVAWSLRRDRGIGLTLSCVGATRIGWVEQILKLERRIDTDGIVSYRTPVKLGGWPAGTTEKAAELDKAKVLIDAGRPAAIAGLRAAGLKPGKSTVLAAALKWRRERPKSAGNSPGNSVPEQSEENSAGTHRDAPSDLFTDQQFPEGNS